MMISFTQTMDDYFNCEAGRYLSNFHSFEQSLISNRESFPFLCTLFNEMLGKTKVFIANAKPYLVATAQKNAVKSIRHVVAVRELERKANAIMGRICPATQSALLPNLPLFFLSECQETIVAHLKSANRLPFYSINALIEYHAEIESELEGEIEDLYQATVKLRFAYHLLADRLDEDDLLEKSELELCFGGSSEFKGALSYAKILHELYLSASLERKELFKFLLDRIMWVKATALKTCFFLTMEKNNSLDAQQTYFADLLDVLEQRKPVEDFYRFYQLATFECPVVEWVILNEICHDVLDMIKGIAKGDKGIFCAGTKDHFVLAQVERSEEDEIVYTLFNTGEGSDLFMRLSGALETFVRPVRFRGLSRDVFTYDFIEKLLKFSIDKETTIESFYAFHLERFKEVGYIDCESAELIRSTPLGTCAYNTFDAWIDSYLTPSEIIKKEKTKVQTALEKQNQVIDFLQKKVWKSADSSESDYLLKKALQLKDLYEIYQAKLADGSQLKELEQRRTTIQAFEQSK
ncbi:Conserved hypothetical protein [Candidatus Protochlamydia naegleriophila]|uniref:Uncharacterized protein n=1 Tax=Candidatus Protochlamydia naegleriophila TaxID=389348 RepID=A0A0U5JIQ8_9BACT|nr:hypothetical protein [Candidatus Protochlamydia naegleriophila]CUI17686.1 Conserved hypothetical protein [Candidatus Protochlamydia naegleriophila]